MSVDIFREPFWCLMINILVLITTKIFSISTLTSEATLSRDMICLFVTVLPKWSHYIAYLCTWQKHHPWCKKRHAIIFGLLLLRITQSFVTINSTVNFSGPKRRIRGWHNKAIHCCMCRLCTICWVFSIGS